MEILSTRTTVMIDMPVVAIVLCGIMLSPIETLGAYVVTVAGYGILGATIFSAASWNPVDSIALSTVVGGMSYAISFLHARNIDEINEQATELASYEVSLVVARKKETIARLSAGIAHEFNNILMIVSGNAEILESTTNVIAVECAQRIRRSTGHAAHLVETVLSLSEQQMLRLTTFDLDEAMAHQQELLQAAMGGNIAILLRRSSESKIVQIDEKLFFDAARILARKAQEGLEGHGVVTIRTGAVNLGPGDADHLPAGPYAVVTIGNGRPAGPEDRVFAPFDPFFLTGCIGNRELDLLAADGIVRQCKGRIELGRDPELGNTFVIMVPRQPSVTA
jgi:signal transduction histidine kinase